MTNIVSMRVIQRLYTQLQSCGHLPKPWTKSCPDPFFNHSRQNYKLSRASSFHTSSPFLELTNPMAWPNHNGSLMDTKSDLNRFLMEVGTDPKEARYWLKYFSSSVDECRTFAVVCVDQEVLDCQNKLESFVSTIAFLQRNRMCPLIVYGYDQQDLSFKEVRDRCVWNAHKLSDMLEKHGTMTHLLYPGCGVLDVGVSGKGEMQDSMHMSVRKDLIMKSLSTHRVPILLSFGETSHGRLIFLKPWDVTAEMAKALQPLKVLFVNSHGGFLDEEGKVIANINLPSDLTIAGGKAWCTSEVMDTMLNVNKLIGELWLDSSVVITSADTILKELFTHRGSGTFFRTTEAIHKYDSLEGIDLSRLKTLLVRSFKKNLSEGYFRVIAPYIHAIYLSESYSGVAILVKGNKVNVPYMCKFAVTNKAQGQGTGEILWDTLRQNEKSLFWRATTYNPVNTWYFKKCEGCWNDQEWSVFWYGVENPSLSSSIIQDARERPITFINK